VVPLSVLVVEVGPVEVHVPVGLTVAVEVHVPVGLTVAVGMPASASALGATASTASPLTPAAAAPEGADVSRGLGMEPDCHARAPDPTVKGLPATDPPRPGANAPLELKTGVTVRVTNPGHAGCVPDATARGG
jgi:hypothetical protein